MRRRSSVSSASGTWTRKGRMASPAVAAAEVGAAATARAGALAVRAAGASTTTANSPAAAVSTVPAKRVMSESFLEEEDTRHDRPGRVRIPLDESIGDTFAPVTGRIVAKEAAGP